MSRCWLCGHPESREVLAATTGGDVTSVDMKISDSHYGRTARIAECLSCGFRYADPLPAPDLVALYSDLEDPDYLEGGEGRMEPFRLILTRCRTLAPGARRLLDIGAGTGLLCLAAREQGLEATGIEPSRWGVEVARTRHRLNVLQGPFPHPGLDGQRFDIVTLIDVIEHVSNPLGLLAGVRDVLEPDGLVVITTPDVRSLAARILGRRWWHYRVAHVCFFTRQTMLKALDQAGLRLVRAEPYAWVLSIGYLAERLERYLPVRRVRTALARTWLGRALFRRRVTLNLHDSITYFAKPCEGKARS